MSMELFEVIISQPPRWSRGEELKVDGAKRMFLDVKHADATSVRLPRPACRDMKSTMASKSWSIEESDVPKRD